MLTDLENCFQFINDNIEFTFVGWYKRGVINDKSIVDSRNIDNSNVRNSDTSYNTNKEDMQVHTAKIRYHIVRINPTNHLFLYPT